MELNELQKGDIIRVPSNVHGYLSKEFTATVIKKYPYHVLVQPKELNYSISIANCDIGKVKLISHGAKQTVEQEFEDVLNELS